MAREDVARRVATGTVAMTMSEGMEAVGILSGVFNKDKDFKGCPDNMHVFDGGGFSFRWVLEKAFVNSVCDGEYILRPMTGFMVILRKETDGVAQWYTIAFGYCDGRLHKKYRRVWKDSPFINRSNWDYSDDLRDFAESAERTLWEYHHLVGAACVM